MKMRTLATRAISALGYVLVVTAIVQPAEAALPRSRTEVRAFRATAPCPSTGSSKGACPGYQVDHIQPLCAGGADDRSNMQWISVDDHKWKTFVDVRECRKARRNQQPL
jgi:hypothetical protein